MKPLTKLIPIAFGLLLLTSCNRQEKTLDYIGTESAKAHALKSAGAAQSDVTFDDVVLDKRDDIQFYSISFSLNGQEYKYDIDALTGVVIDSKITSTSSSSQVAQPESQVNFSEPDTGKKTDAVVSATSSQSATAPTSDMISEEKAKSAALAHANLNADTVTFAKVRLDYDDMRQVYDVEFYTKDYKEYDYEIDAFTGEIVSYDFDADSYTPPANTESTITADKAKQIALGQVSGAAVTDIFEFETDYDDGRLSYEGKIYYGGREYEFEIDGYSGAIRSWESESIKR